MTGKHRRIHCVIGSGNVFRDLALPEPDQALVKADLVKAICGVLAGRDLRQAEIARQLGIPQPKVSLLLRGRTTGFSTDYLMRLLNRLGQSIRIVVRPAAPGHGAGSTQVVRDGASRPARTAEVHALRGIAGTGRAHTVVRKAARKAVRRKVARKK